MRIHTFRIQFNISLVIFAASFLVFIPKAKGQTPFSSTQFLSEYTSESDLLHIKKTETLLKSVPYDLGWLEELEFRTESDEMNLSRQEYLVRARFNSKKTKAAYQNIHQNRFSEIPFEKLILISEDLSYKYDLLIDYFFLLKEQSAYLKLESNYADRDKLMGILSQQGKIPNVKAVFDLESKKAQNRSEQKLLEAEIQNLQKVMGQEVNQNIGLLIDTSNFIGLVEMLGLIAQIPDTPSIHPQIERRIAQTQQSKAEYDLEVQENKKWFDYVQAKYSYRPNQDFQKEWAIGAGVNIPMKKSSNRLKEKDRLIDFFEDQQGVESEMHELVNEIQLSKRELTTLLIEFQESIRINKELSEKFASQNLPISNLDNPMDLLDIQEALIEKRADLLGIEKDIYQQYLDLLNKSGWLVQGTFKNYLMKGFPSFEIANY